MAIGIYIRSRSTSLKSEITPLPVKLRGDLLYENGVPSNKSAEQKSLKTQAAAVSPIPFLANSNPIFARVASFYSKSSQCGDSNDKVWTPDKILLKGIYGSKQEFYWVLSLRFVSF